MSLLAKGREAAAALFGRSGALVASRLASAVLTFGLPLALVRLLAPAEFGTYKQFFLVGQTVLLIGQLGLSQSLFYFLPRGGPDAPRHAAQALSGLALLGFAFGAALWLFAPAVAHALASPELVGHRAALGVFTGCMLAAAPLEGALVSLGSLRAAAVIYTASDVLRAFAILAGAWLLGPDFLYWGAALVAALRVFGLWSAVAGGKIPFARPDRRVLQRQLAYCLPFAGATLLFVLLRYLSQYVISAWSNPATFALFAVASFHLPVVDIVYTPMSDVLMVELGQAAHLDDRHRLERFRSSVTRLATVLLPATAGAWLVGPTLLPALFTRKYAGAVPLFLLATAEIPLWMFPCDALMRAAGETRFFFWFNALRVPIQAGLVVGGIHWFGLPGAIAGGIAGEGFARVVLLLRGRRFLGARARDLVAWGELWRIAGSAAAACLPGWVVLHAVPRALPSVALAAVAYGATYFALLFAARRREPGRAMPIAATG